LLHTKKYSSMSGCIKYIMHFIYTRPLQSIVLDARATNQARTSHRTVQLHKHFIRTQCVPHTEHCLNYEELTW